MRMILGWTMVAMLALGGCHSASSDHAVDNASFPVTVNPARGVPNEQPLHRAEIIKQALMIPTALQGRWGMTPSDCDISRNDTKGLLVIGKDKLDFYESKATIDALSKASQNEITADLTFTGEGQTWKRRETLQTAIAGTRLLRTEQSPTKTFRYVRC